MARGTIVKRCPICKKNGSRCAHKEATYSIVYRVGSRQKWESAGSNKKSAERRLAEVTSQINNGSYFAPNAMLFNEFADKWLEGYARVAVKPSTLRTYTETIRNHFKGAFGDMPVTSISTESIQSYISKELKALSPKTVNNHLTLLKTMFKYAKRWKYVRDNPALDVDRARQEFREMSFLIPGEVSLLLNKSHEPYKTLFMTAVFTGMRRGELLALKWGDIDWNKNLIFVRRSLYFSLKSDAGKRWNFSEPKSKKSIRAIVMSPMLKRAFELHKISCPVSGYDLVFCGRDGNPIDPDNMVKREFIPSLTAAGLKHIRFHDLRHTYTALLIAQNENIKFIQSQLGHASVQTTIDRYGHLFPEANTASGAKLDGQVFGHSANSVLTEQAQTAANTL